MTRLTGRLAADREYLERLLLWPENIGVEFREVQLPTAPPVPALLVWIEGLAADEAIARDLLHPLKAYRGPAVPDVLAQALPVPEQRLTRDLDLLADQVLSGYTALLVDGWLDGLVVNTVGYSHLHAKNQSYNANQDRFGADLRFNVALLRKRLRTPAFRAIAVRVPNGRAGSVAVAWVEGRAYPPLVRLLRWWSSRHVGEESMSRGIVAGGLSAVGLLPRFNKEAWPDKTATLLETGHVAMLVDRVTHVGTAPVNLALMLFSASDTPLGLPITRWLLRLRVALYLLVLLLPGTVVALLNYHPEMIPTPFLLAMASTRENAPFGVFFEVLLLELVTEISREASFRLPLAFNIGYSMVTVALVALVAVQTGLVGPLPAIAGMLGSLASLALPSYGGTYLVRTWRIYLLFAAVFLGFFGMAAVAAILLTYLSQARSWGVPFWGPSGLHLTAPEANAAHPPRGKGRKGNVGQFRSDIR